MRRMRLRTKFLLSILAISAGLRAATLAVVGYGIQQQVRSSMRDDLHNSVRTYQSFEQQRAESLARSAELLADLPDLRALMTTKDIPTIQDESENIAELSSGDLLVLADRTATWRHSAATNWNSPGKRPAKNCGSLCENAERETGGSAPVIYTKFRFSQFTLDPRQRKA